MSPTWRQFAGQLLMVGFDGPVAPPALLERIAAGEVGGVILFARNITGPRQVAELTSCLRQAAPEDCPLLVSVDQEGGRVQRLRQPMAVWPAMKLVAERGDPELTYRLGRAIAQDLACLGFNLNFAPVLDVVTSPENSVIGDRSFGPTAEGVISHGLSLAQGLLAEGVLPCVKHFPGHGGPVADSHVTLPVERRSRVELEQLDLQPFEAAVAAELPLIMSAHVLYPALDPEHPGTLSSRICTELLRGQLRFDGVLTSDDMEMGAITKTLGPAESTLAALTAGVDLLLFCQATDKQQLALEALVEGARSHPGIYRRVEEAAFRVQRLKARLGEPRRVEPHVLSEAVDAKMHQQLLSELTVPRDVNR